MAAVSHTSSACFYWLRQIRRIRRSLDTESAKTLVHAFVSSRVDRCNAMLAGSSSACAKCSSSGPQWNSQVRPRFDTSASLRAPLAGYKHIQFKLGVTVHRCLRGNALQYLVNCCKSTTDAISRQRLRSAQQVAISSSYHDIVAPFSAETISVIRRLAKTLLGDY